MIPHIIHQIWVGSEVPTRFVDYIDSWKTNHPDWGYFLWTDEHLPPMINYELYRDAEYYAPQNVGQFRADILRLELLRLYGGVYVDIDFEAKKSIEPLLTNDVELFAAWEETGVWVNNAIMGACAQHPFIVEMIKHLPENVKAAVVKRPNHMSGPRYLTRLINEFKPDIKIFPKEHFYPYLYNELDRIYETFPNAYAIHHWNNRRTNRPRR